ncbi:ornithine cyclodeaminase family protein [Methylovirgula sp. 4M-Z18]|uniref:ornithine cyclodeaminase family protein n=1 Tax=Methylovirgula sp. 4M-Z18 TaxID=2293567 RepID=UPI000E2F097E|nr:ornithine cyclodeaminase family protein [Methylovirgula sp. 4M-Z18]RFB79011.1 ornithine cyclodeaminase family protein [Methylovirgula sp. 4M-Z18]
MQVISAQEIDRLLDYPSLIVALRDAFGGTMVAPVRHHHEVGSGAGHATHLIMPAWTGDAPGGGFVGTKIVNVFPANSAKGLPAVYGSYLLQSGETGAPLVVLDGTRLTHWRTAAASALAASFLARDDAAHLLVIGAGALAPELIKAHSAVRPIKAVTLWNHRRESAERLAASLAGSPYKLAIADDLAAAVAGADIISCATLSQQPIVLGQWLQPGTHVDLVGAFNMAMREADDAALLRAKVFVDTPAAKHEGGDVAVALHAGAVPEAHIRGDLAALCAGKVHGRDDASDITLFKSVGASIEDLAAAMLVWRKSQAKAA